jgi:hypothetical protein
MANVPSAENNINIDVINQRFDSIKIHPDTVLPCGWKVFIPEDGEPQIVRSHDNHEEYDDNDYVEEHDDNDYVEEEPIDVYENMMGTSALSKQANTVLSSIKDKILFVHETYSLGGFGRSFGSEEYWTLYVVVVRDWVYTKLKFYREIFFRQGDKKDEIAYDSVELSRTDNDIFEVIYDQLSSDPEVVVYNADPSQLSKSAQATIAMVKNEVSGKVFFTGEEENYGETDREGPLEYNWTLYVFIQNEDGAIVRRKFFREFDWRHDECDMDDVPYEEYIMDRKDKKKKFCL